MAGSWGTIGIIGDRPVRIQFERYHHVNDLLRYYASEKGRDDVLGLLDSGVESRKDAEVLSRFVWTVAELVTEDEEKGRVVLGSSDNTEMLQDFSYEMTKYMREVGYYSVWKRISDEEMQ